MSFFIKSILFTINTSHIYQGNILFILSWMCAMVLVKHITLHTYTYTHAVNNKKRRRKSNITSIKWCCQLFWMPCMHVNLRIYYYYIVVVLYILFTRTHTYIHTSHMQVKRGKKKKIRIANKTAHYFWLLCENEMNVIIKKKALNISLVYKLVIKMCFSLIFSYDYTYHHDDDDTPRSCVCLRSSAYKYLLECTTKFIVCHVVFFPFFFFI